MNGGAALVLEEVRIRLPGRDLLSRFSLRIGPGECATLMGPSGSGKSTLLAWLAGTLDPVFEAGGRATVGGEDITGLAPERRRLGILFQDDLLFPHLSIGENLAFALPAQVRGRARRRAEIAAALGDAGLAGFEARDPATLSGGQRARVALMRTLLAQPRALLLDEPFNKLDAQLRSDFRQFVFAHAGQRGLPTLMVTHDEADALAAGGRVLRFDPAGEGRIVEGTAR